MSGEADSRILDTVQEALLFHNTPPALIDKLVAAARSVERSSRPRYGPTRVVAGALGTKFSFAPLPERNVPRPFLLIGPPGVGKTITVAKLAARLRLRNRSVAVVSADTVRAGALEQRAFTRSLEVNPLRASGPEALRKAPWMN
ncbi:MAG: flagellar biosynthesis protein FlhF [Rhodospirillaceae bacterium]|nr:MAG: flagellar biosynthesis protein FlhF [Rhodospirillaceae bacterium]